jgi:protein-L-isoaspartate(D-aspartate) O-methyltransferase
MLYRYTKKDGKLVAEPLRPTLFVPMTGAAEAGREVQPDPLHPQTFNGSFEDVVGTENEPRGWYYCRQMKVVDVDADTAAQLNKISLDPKPVGGYTGKHYLQFTNDVKGRTSRALQGFAVDGKKISQIEVSATVRGRNIVAGESVEELPQISLTYYDDNWAIIGRTFTGPYRGSFEWKHVSEKLNVPTKASKCIMHIGLLGATGEFDIDDVSIHPIAR